jgi:hypothetical protein
MRQYFFALVLWLFITFTAKAQVPGCTDSKASNFNPAATQNNGACVYENVTIAPIKSVQLSDTLHESSGLVLYGNRLYTHNDNTDINLYALDSSNGNIKAVYALTGLSNIDWEDVTQDDQYFYIGDFGNNSSGNRRNLKVYKVSKLSLLSRNPVVETIAFSYEAQTDFTPQASNQTNFDCEAMVASKDSLYLFSKEWVSNITRVYALPKVPGNYSVKPSASLDVKGLITGATLLEHKRLLVLTGYSSLLMPFVYLLYDYEPSNFFSGNKRKVSLDLGFHQIEAISSLDGKKYFISNELFVRQPFANNPQKMHVLDLSPLLSHYLDGPASVIKETVVKQQELNIFPVPSDGVFNLNGFDGALELFDVKGAILKRFEPSQGLRKIDCSDLAAGYYFLKGEGIETIKLKVEKP